MGAKMSVLKLIMSFSKISEDCDGTVSLIDSTGKKGWLSENVWSLLYKYLDVLLSRVFKLFPVVMTRHQPLLPASPLRELPRKRGRGVDQIQKFVVTFYPDFGVIRPKSAPKVQQKKNQPTKKCHKRSKSQGGGGG